MGEHIAAFLTAVIGLAIVGVLVSKNAQTPQVLQSGGQALGGLITAAVSPVTGGNNSLTGLGSIPGVGGLSAAFGAAGA